MTSVAKVLVPNSEWLIQDEHSKIAGLTKAKKGYTVFRKGIKLEFANLSEIKNQFGISLIEEDLRKIKDEQLGIKRYEIYGFPCDVFPHEPLYNIKKKLPIYVKHLKSKSQYCAGYYSVKVRRGWIKIFCPKLITLDRYPFHGPFNTAIELTHYLNNSDQF